MAHEKVYGVREDKCLVETYSKDEIDELVAGAVEVTQFDIDSTDISWSDGSAVNFVGLGTYDATSKVPSGKYLYDAKIISVSGRPCTGITYSDNLAKCGVEFYTIESNNKNTMGFVTTKLIPTSDIPFKLRVVVIW